MIRLAPGTPKYLLLDHREIDRNKERRKSGASIVRVVEHIPQTDTEPPCLRIYRAYSARAVGSVELAYSQNTPLLRVRLAPDLPDEDIYAAYITHDEVRLAETHGECLDVEDIAAEPAVEPATESTAKAKKQK